MAVYTPKEFEERYNVTNKQAKEWWAKKNSDKYTDEYFKSLKRKNKVKWEKKIEKAKTAIRASELSEMTGSTVTGCSNTDPWQIIYGRNRIGGTIVYISSHKNNIRSETIENGILYVCCILACHKINSIEQFFMDNQRVVFSPITSLDPRHADYTIDNQGDRRWAIDVCTGKDENDNNTYASSLQGLKKWKDVGWWIFLDRSTIGDTSDGANDGAFGEIGKDWGRTVPVMPYDQPQLPEYYTERAASPYRLDGYAWCFMEFVWKSPLFDNGLNMSGLEFVVQGAKVFDPRTNTTVYTNNPALLINDYLTNTRYGLGIPQDKIDSTWLIESANRCDDTNGIYGGGKRYTADMVFQISDSPQTVLEELCNCMAGCLVYSEGKWKIHAGYFYPPEYFPRTITLEEDDILSNIDVNTNNSRKDIFNHCRGTFRSEENFVFENSEFPSIKNDTYTQYDCGQEIWEDFDFAYTSKSTMAQRLAHIAMEKARSGLTCSFTATLKAYPLEAFDTLYVKNKALGWDSMNDGKGKLFVVESSQLIIEHDNTSNPFFAVELNLRETASNIYDANINETAKDSSPNTVLSSPFITKAPTNLQAFSGTDELVVLDDGTIAARVKLTWTGSTDTFTSSGGYYRIEYKKHSDDDSAWLIAGTIEASANSYYISDVNSTTLTQRIVESESYDFRVCGVSALGVESDYATLLDYTVVGKTEPPSDVENLTANQNEYGIGLNWDEIPDLDCAGYIIKYGTNWATGTEIAQVQANKYTWKIQEAGEYHIMIKAIDTSGNESTNAASINKTIYPPDQVDTITISLDGVNLNITWNEVLPSVARGQFAIKQYNLYYSNSVDSTKILLNSVKGTSYKYKADYSNDRYFWIEAEDEYGNKGEATYNSFNITVPTAVTNLTSTVVDNNTLHKWSEPATHTLPIDHYQIYKGSSADMAQNENLGSVFGTFTTYFETLAATYTYWIVPIDSAGNAGSPKRTICVVSQPRDYSIEDTHFMTTVDSVSNAYSYNDGFLLPVNTSETYGEHFTNNSKTTWKDFVDAGFEKYYEPSESDGYVERVYTFYSDENHTTEVAIPQSIIQFTFSADDVAASPAVTTFQLSYYNLATGSWVSAAEGATSMVGTGFSRVKIRFTAESSDGKACIDFNNINMTLLTKTVMDQGTETTDAAGYKEVSFLVPFFDVQSLNVTPLGNSSQIFVIVDFLDVTPAPATFKVYLKDINGDPVQGTFSWIARGVENIN